MQIVVISPVLDVVLADQIHGTDQLHALEIRAVQLGQHGLHLRAVEHAHDRCLDDVVEVVAECDLVAAERLRLAVKIAAAHAGAQVARVLFAVVGDLEYVSLENGDRDVQQRGVAFDLVAVDLIIAGVHDEENDLERDLAVPLEQLHQLGHQHGVLAARDADGDLIICLDELIALDGDNERGPELFAVLFDDASFDQLVRFQFAFHGYKFLSFSGAVLFGFCQSAVAAVKGGQKAAQVFFGGSMAQADPPGGQGVAAVPADGKDRAGGEPV